MMLGVAQCRTGRWQEAAEALRRADELGGGNSCVYFFLAMADWQIGQRQAALDWYEQALECDEAQTGRYSERPDYRDEANACIGLAAGP